jgi:hypothetical protein
MNLAVWSVLVVFDGIATLVYESRLMWLSFIAYLGCEIGMSGQSLTADVGSLLACSSFTSQMPMVQMVETLEGVRLVSGFCLRSVLRTRKCCKAQLSTPKPHQFQSIS